MSSEVEQPSDTSILPLLSGIVEDVQKLMHQEVGLVKAEVKEETDRIKASAGSFALGIFVGMLAVVLLALGVVMFLAQTDYIPLWGAYCIVAVLLGGLAYILLKNSHSKFTEKNAAVLRDT
jgi:hypothetical protein